uniref:EF-hand domain-containing protein n=1 Tax=Chromera velia CCMP2878 TaxID=1169474 RepID=A0A0G4F813_9ALVE|eukprot:Cvel_15636.t1-p1 / transcript=Cvel_15636.t1 / gene=Cvel_15636 / organism=Chromera_velia_CCMP2878 / gene_product=hypothetical protein / transcript_product=hypothetical protein / location=Cvel_scaffold1165:25541-28166(+) / protein_length=412 / sequence_SO=supercontig / SO=protein_coding / is_pseudo=false
MEAKKKEEEEKAQKAKEDAMKKEKMTEEKAQKLKEEALQKEKEVEEKAQKAKEEAEQKEKEKEAEAKAAAGGGAEEEKPAEEKNEETTPHVLPVEPPTETKPEVDLSSVEMSMGKMVEHPEFSKISDRGFQHADVDGSGHLDVAEVKKAMTIIQAGVVADLFPGGALMTKLDDKTAEDTLARFDDNRNGTLSMDEYRAFTKAYILGLVLKKTREKAENGESVDVVAQRIEKRVKDLDAMSRAVQAQEEEAKKDAGRGSAPNPKSRMPPKRREPPPQGGAGGPPDQGQLMELFEKFASLEKWQSIMLTSFADLDTDGSGEMNANELSSMMEKMQKMMIRSLFPSSSLEAVDEEVLMGLMTEYDKTGDSRISKDEFVGFTNAYMRLLVRKGAENFPQDIPVAYGGLTERIASMS